MPRRRPAQTGATEPRGVCSADSVFSSGVLKLNNGSNPVARVGDTALVNSPMGALSGTIQTGNTTVQA
jgi:hypothetical protein